jgi:uncharacterized protein (TIGR00369 family)
MTDLDPAAILESFRRYGHNSLTGVVYHAHGDDWVEMAMPYRKELAGDAETGILASGPIFTLMDMVTSTSIWVKSGLLRPQATLDLRVDYLRPAEPGKTVIGRGQCYKLTRSIAFVRGEAHDGDPTHPIAHVAGTFMFTAEA